MKKKLNNDPAAVEFQLRTKIKIIETKVVNLRFKYDLTMFKLEAAFWFFEYWWCIETGSTVLFKKNS